MAPADESVIAIPAYPALESFDGSILIPVSQPVPILMAVSTALFGVVMESIFIPFRLPLVLPVAAGSKKIKFWVVAATVLAAPTTFNPLTVLIVAVGAVVLTFRPFQVQAPPVQPVNVGAATLRAFVSLVPVAPVVLRREAMFIPFNILLPLVLLEVLAKFTPTTLAMSPEVVRV